MNENVDVDKFGYFFSLSLKYKMNFKWIIQTGKKDQIFQGQTLKAKVNLI